MVYPLESPGNYLYAAQGDFDVDGWIDGCPAPRALSASVRCVD